MAYNHLNITHNYHKVQNKYVLIAYNNLKITNKKCSKYPDNSTLPETKERPSSWKNKDTIGFLNPDYSSS